MSASISEGKVATIFLHFEEFLRKAGKLNMFDTLVYNYRLRTSLTQEALRDFYSNLTNFLTQVRNLLKSEGPLDSYRLAKDSNSAGSIPLSTNIRINCLSHSDSVRGYGSGKLKVVNRNKLSHKKRRRALEQPNISIMNSLDASDLSLSNPEDSSQGDSQFPSLSSNVDLPFFSCSNCSNAYKTRNSFVSHPCVQENKTGKEYLIEDLETLLKVRRFLCGQCVQEFRSYNRILAHLPKCESGPYPCELCNTNQTLLFSTIRSLNLHKSAVHKHDRSFICNECGHSFAFKSSLLKHKAHTHENPAKTFQCESCDKIFTKRILLTNHKLKYHQVQVEKKFNCEHCSNSYMSSSSLRAHLEIRHKQTKKHKCEFCDKEFLRKDKLQIHLSSHTGIRPFICEICGKSFSRKSKLTDHHARHLGEKKYVCTEEACSKSYASNTDLKIHVRNVHTNLESGTEVIVPRKRKPRLKLSKTPKTKLKLQPAAAPCAPDDVELAISPGIFQDDSISLAPLMLSMDDDPNGMIQIQNPFNYPSPRNYDAGANFQLNSAQPEAQCVLPPFATTQPEFSAYSALNVNNNPGYEMYESNPVVQNPGNEAEAYQHQQYSNVMVATGNTESMYQMQYNYTSSNMNVNMNLVTESHTEHYGFNGNDGMLVNTQHEHQIYQHQQPYYTDQTQNQNQYLVQNQPMLPNEFSEYGLFPAENYASHNSSQY